jgi:hypothetical protein
MHRPKNADNVSGNLLCVSGNLPPAPEQPRLTNLDFRLEDKEKLNHGSSPEQVLD